MYGVGEAITGLFYAFVFAIGAAIILALYVFWQTFFGFTPWEVCVKMDTDTAIVQCMKAHYDQEYKMEKLIVRGVNKMVFEIDPVTLEPKTCAYYDAWCFSDPEKYVKYINHAEWHWRTKS